MNAAVEEDIQRHRALVAALCRRHGARRLDLFGSANRDDIHAQHSDLDFLVEFEDLEPTQYAQAYFELKEGLERLFGRTDVHPVRWGSAITGESGNAPAYANEWRASICDSTNKACHDCQGSITLMPHPSKSGTFLVATSAPADFAMAAICASN